MFIGGAIPFLVSSITMTAVGDAAFDMINEIRRQFKEIPGLLEGTGSQIQTSVLRLKLVPAQRMCLPESLVSMPP